jgi:hypothetical protein
MPHLRRVLVALALASILGAVGAQRAVVMQSADPNTLDPTQNRETPTFNALLNIYDALLFKNPDGSFAPSLAESWTATSDTTWEFELREGVRFHDGTAFDAEAVVYTIGRIQDEEAASPIAGGFAFIAEAVAEGPHRLRITTTRPTPLAEHYFSELLIVSPAPTRQPDRPPSRAPPWVPGPIASARGRVTSSSSWRASRTTGAARRRCPRSSSGRCPRRSPATPRWRLARPTSSSRSRQPGRFDRGGAQRPARDGGRRSRDLHRHQHPG